MIRLREEFFDTNYNLLNISFQSKPSESIVSKVCHGLVGINSTPATCIHRLLERKSMFMLILRLLRNGMTLVDEMCRNDLGIEYIDLNL